MIKFIKYSVVAGASTLLLLFSSCSNDHDTSSPLESVSLSVGGQEVDNRAVSLSGESFFVQVASSSSWMLSLSPASASEWVHLERTQGQATQGEGIAVKIDANSQSAGRSASLILSSGTLRKEIRLTQGVSVLNDDSRRIEVPRLSGSAQDLFVVHRTQDGTVNYCLEYNTQRYHSRWAAFIFDDHTAARNWTQRTNQWAWDPLVPKEFSTENLFGNSGYSRGHMVASSDRYYSKDANEQTFYYTNMSPQLQVHNGGVWADLEQRVQNWGRNPSFRKVLYVVKGGTIDDANIEARKVGGKIVVPKYYFMALVVQKPDGAYHGIAFWTEHRGYARYEVRSLAITIDELEQRTGIDFFPNLDDETEARVESEAPGNNWPGV